MALPRTDSANVTGGGAEGGSNSKEVARLRTEVEKLRAQEDQQLKFFLLYMQELDRLRNERAEAIAVARRCCEEGDFWNGWPDSLHLADVIEKRIFNLCLDWRGEGVGDDG